MKLNVDHTHPEKRTKSILMVGIYENGDMTPTAKTLDKMSKGEFSKLLKKTAFSGKIGQTLALFHLPHTHFEYLLLVGCGALEKLSPLGFRKLIITATKALKSAPLSQVTCYLSEIEVADKNTAWKVRQMVEAIHEAQYVFDQFKSKKEPRFQCKELTIHLPATKEQAVCDHALKQGEAIAAGMVLAKDLANTPSNICTPTFLAAQAQALAKTSPNLSVKILNEKTMRQLGMGALLAVSQGSEEEAKLICLEYKGGAKKAAPVALIGKGITFDTGGNSLKPADSMVGMKYDMCGAATVLGTFKALAQSRLPINVVGLVAAAENMPGGTAYNPEDILTSMSQQTIEVISTDAEGRLVLADALTYCERYKPDAVIDIATLTGAVVVALGFHATGLLANHEPLANALLKAGEESNDRAWQLPLWEEYQEQIKSPFADMANVGGRSAGAITAACFLSRFAKKFHWAHLDVAGTAAMMAGTADRHATGRPIPLLMQYLIDRCQK